MRFKVKQKAMKKIMQILLIIKLQHMMAMVEAVVVAKVEAAEVDRVVSTLETMKDQVIKIREPEVMISAITVEIFNAIIVKKMGHI